MARLSFAWLMCGCLGMGAFPLCRVHADSWQLTMRTGDNENVWLVDERLGVKLQLAAQPELEIFLRPDLRQTIWNHPRLGIYALQPWTPGGATQGGVPIVNPRAAKALERSEPGLRSLDPKARMAAQRNLAKRFGQITDGQTGRGDMQYQRTGQVKKVGKQNTKQVVEFLNGQPTGRVFWVTEYPGWEKLATALQESLDNFAALPPNRRIPFKELQGIPLEMDEADGTMSQIVDMRPLKLMPPAMQPDPQAQQIDLPTFMQQAGQSQQAPPQ